MNFVTLVSDIQSFMEDDGTEFVAAIPTIITQAEEIIFQRLPNLRMIRQVSITISNVQSYLDHRVDSYLRDYWPNSTLQGTPEMYSTKNATTSGTIITLAPTPDAVISHQVDFIAPETGLSSGNANSWIGDNAENLLLSACLYESSAFLKAPETLNLYKAQFDEAVQLFQQQMARDYTAEYNGGI